MHWLRSEWAHNPYLVELINVSRRLPTDHLVVVDCETGIKATCTDLIAHVCAFRVKIAEVLGEEVLENIRNEQQVFVATILPPGYDFVVAFLAILSLGAGVVPLSTKLIPEEVAYYVSKSGSKLILCDEQTSELVNLVPGVLASSKEHGHNDGPLQVLCRKRETLQTFKSMTAEVLFDTTWDTSPETPSLILFTSGTTGSPKGAMFPRRYLYDMSHLTTDALGITDRDIFLHTRGIHWVSGIRWSIGIILVGARVEFCESRMTPAWWCSRVAQGGVTMSYEMPRIWMSIMLEIARLDSPTSRSDVRSEDVKKALKSARMFMSGGTPAISKVIEYWNEVLENGLFTNLWGITELGGILTYHTKETSSSDVRCVGRLIPGVSAKINEDGQICIKSPLMFSGYVSDPVRSKAALDSEGYYKTGDAGELRNNTVYLMGRIGFDFIRFKGLKMAAAEVEEKIKELPSVQDVVVLPLPDEEFGQRVAAVIHARPNGDAITLKSLRATLRSSLPAYKLPTVLVVLKEPLLETTSGKVAKGLIRKQYLESELAPVLHRERWKIAYESGARRRFMWDWGGMH